MYAKLSSDFWFSVSQTPKLSQVSSPGRDSLAPTTSSAAARWGKTEECGHPSSCTWWVSRWPWGRELRQGHVPECDRPPPAGLWDRHGHVVLGIIGELTLAGGKSGNKTVWGSSVPLKNARCKHSGLGFHQTIKHTFLQSTRPACIPRNGPTSHLCPGIQGLKTQHPPTFKRGSLAT